MTFMTNSRTIRTIAIAMFALVLGVMGQTASADITMTSESLTSGSNTGSFDLFLDVTGDDVGAGITGWNATILPLTAADVTGDLLPEDVTLTFAGDPINTTDIFPSPANPVAIPAVSGSGSEATDFALVAATGLMNVGFEVPAGKTGSFSIKLDNTISPVFDASFNIIPGVDYAGGTVSIVPEPSTLVCGFLGLIGLLGLRRRLF